MRMTIVVVALAVLAAGCADSSPRLAETSSDLLRLDLTARPAPLVTGEPATFELRVTNTGDERALLTFDTTQHGDVIFSTEDVDVYRWAERRAFANERDRYELAPGQQVVLELDEAPLPVPPGEYEVLAVVTGLPKLQSVETSVSVGRAPADTEAMPSSAASPSA